MEQFTEAVSKVGEVLPRAELSAALYPTDRMKKAISMLYAHIIRFFQKAVKWYNRSPAGRAFSAMVKPFELSLKDIVEKINSCSRTVDQIASAAAKAELRMLHQKVIELTQIVMGEFEHVRRRPAGLTVEATHSISNRIHLDLRDQRNQIWDLQFSQIKLLLKIEPSPQETLQSSLSMARRRQTPGHQGSIPLSALRLWASSPGSSLLILKASPRAEFHARDVCVDVIRLLHPTHQIPWFLSTQESNRRKLSRIDVLKSLILQAMLLHPNISATQPNGLNVDRFQREHSEIEWADLLCLVLQDFRCLFVVVETGLLADHDSFLIAQLLQRVVDRVPIGIKALVVGFTSSALSSAPNRIIGSIQAPLPIPVRKRRLVARGRGQNGPAAALRPYL